MEGIMRKTCASKSKLWFSASTKLARVEIQRHAAQHKTCMCQGAGMHECTWLLPWRARYVRACER
eukprot:1956137-Pleurochrysis_carterae.AAC.1